MGNSNIITPATLKKDMNFLWRDKGETESQPFFTNTFPSVKILRRKKVFVIDMWRSTRKSTTRPRNQNVE